MVEFGNQYALPILGAFAFGHVDVDADHPLRLSMAVIQNETTRFDPAQRAVGPNDAILDIVFTNALTKGIFATLGDPIDIFRMRPGAPFAPRRLCRSFRQTVQRDVTLGYMHDVRIEFIGIAANQGGLSRQGELQVALCQGILGSFSVGDISRQTFDAQELALLVKFRLGRLLEPNLAAVRTAEPEIEGV